MNIYERIETLQNDTELRLENAKEVYKTAEAELVQLVGEYVVGAEINNKAYGAGHIISFYGTTLDGIIVEVEFAAVTKKFSLMHIVTVGQFSSFVDTLEIGVIWNDAMAVHNTLTAQLRELNEMERQLALDAEKKAETEKKAEEKYQKAKAKALKDFDEQTKVVSPKNATEEFYQALGWLAKHMGTLTAILPDYLGSAFEKHFGSEAPKTLIDGRAKTSGGYAKQWSWEFKCTIKKLKDTEVPACFRDVTADFSKGIHNTSFLWDLVDNYGFQFGKTQDLDKIRACVPAQCLESFESGLAL